MNSTFWMTAQEAEDEIKRRESVIARWLDREIEQENRGQHPEIVSVVNQRQI